MAMKERLCEGDFRDDKKRGVLQRSKEEGPKEKEAPETEQSLSGSRDQKEVRVAGAA